MTIKTIINALQKIKSDLESFIPEIEKQLKLAPPGELHDVHCKGKLLFRKKEGNRIIYIGQRITDQIKKLMQKKYDSMILLRIDDELTAIEKAVKILEKIKLPEDTLSSLDPIYSEIVQKHTTERSKQFLAWQKQPYTKKPIPMNSVYMSLQKEPMRSKSEVIIADRLFFHLVPYRYEQAMEITAFDVIHPDFTIRHPRTGEIFIWEHFGMMDDPKYAQGITKRINELKSKGFILGKNLIITIESRDYPLDSSLVEELIEFYFL